MRVYLFLGLEVMADQQKIMPRLRRQNPGLADGAAGLNCPHFQIVAGNDSRKFEFGAQIVVNNSPGKGRDL